MVQDLAVLPEDVIVEVLRRLPPHSIAASRWVCKAWRDAVDARLRSHLLSHSVRGIFINYDMHSLSEFFSRPSTGPVICGGLDSLPYVPGRDLKVRDHYNGLMLCRDYEQDYVVNPATQRWARLPQCPPTHLPGFNQTAYIAFDPALSPQYEVYLIPRVPYGALKLEDSLLEMEWPPASHMKHVFWSMTRRWDKKTFLREGEATAGVVADVAESNHSYFNENCAVY
ncbi:hypothetical protein ACQ4PT_041007 [Festuca glaucescens]